MANQQVAVSADGAVEAVEALELKIAPLEDVSVSVPKAGPKGIFIQVGPETIDVDPATLRGIAAGRSFEHLLYKIVEGMLEDAVDMKDELAMQSYIQKRTFKV